MATIKSYTDIEQSRKLAEILPLESADMYYHYDYDFDELESIPTITEEDDHFVLFSKDVRCWSLAALLGVLPNGCLIKNINGKYKVLSNSSCVINDVFNNPVDACVAMIEKLHELNLL